MPPRQKFVITNFCRSACLGEESVEESLACVSRETRAVCLCGRRNLHSAVIAAAFTLGRYSRVIREKEVDDAAF